MNKKICARCKTEKPVDEFYKNKSRDDGFSYWCKNCQDVYNIKYRRRPETKIKRADWYKKHGVNKQIFARYGITMKERDEMIEMQGGLCPICNEELDRKTNTCIDHDHKTATVRGILCRDCNFMLGMSKDNLDTLRSAADYIDKYKD